jgi:adenylylsulfate kinase
MISNGNNVTWHCHSIQREQRRHLNGHRSVVLWFTGLSNSGKSTLANAVEAQLHSMAYRTYVLDGDNVRHGLCSDLGFSAADRTENIRRIGELTKLLVDAGMIVLTAFISPFSADRDRVRRLFMHGDFIEIYCRCDVSACERRDAKGIYQRARAGEIEEFTGISSAYEEPLNPELTIETEMSSIEGCVAEIIEYLRRRDILSQSSS